ncbi:hypothetical protein ACNFCJ_08060 [Pseudomonas sp. NY15364]|uniref:hypothetical protein n=1 Tax=Pseudomonas sp. NY15364 TaxID=3400353 RepID=UPI003A8BF02F
MNKRLEDNQKHRAMFSLPPIQSSDETALVAQDLPPQKVVTGDKEVDALLWLREVISTGQEGLIAIALEAAKNIKTPFKELEKRYTQKLIKDNPGNWAAAFSSFGFADIQGLAERSIEKEMKRREANARFPGETIWDNTPAEDFCVTTLKRCPKFKDCTNYDKEAVKKRFLKHADLLPFTLTDCLHELNYWSDLYWLRNSFGSGDGPDEATVREWFVFGLLAEIKPRSHAEAKFVLWWLREKDRNDHQEYDAIVNNLLDHPGMVVDQECFSSS